MKRLLTKSLILLFAMSVLACGNNEDKPDASGVFEATEIITSAEMPGKVVELNISESQLLKKDEVVGLIDTIQLNLKKQQLEANKRSILAGRPDIPAQIAATEKEIAKQEQEKTRIENLLAGDVATQKQMDDISSILDVLNAKLRAQKSSLNRSTSSIYAQSSALHAQIMQIEDQIGRCHIKSPIDGTVLVKYAESGEMTGAGKPLFKIADLSKIFLRAYVSGDQLSQIQLNQNVMVRTDEWDDFKTTDGKITWISDKAEFTPKAIQTKNERANKVYAIKVVVENDGSYKIGMYGEVVLD